jgi:hypothetical protein
MQFDEETIAVMAAHCQSDSTNAHSGKFGWGNFKSLERRP